jgi:hypothetical protein
MQNTPKPLKELWSATFDDYVGDMDSVPDFDAITGSGGLAYYLSLPTSEYQNKPKFKAFLQCLVTPLNDAINLAVNLPSFFDIDTAIGAQLDLVGELVGQQRTINFTPTDSSSPVLGDNDYRVLLKATIIKNNWDGTIPSLYASWQSLFPGGLIVIIDNQDMTMDLTISGNFSSVVHDLIINGYIVPRPAGVLINYSLGTLPVFGFDRETNYVAGFDVGSWAVLT